MFQIVTIASAALVCSCSWDKTASEATKEHFLAHKADYLSALAFAQTGKSDEDLKRAYPTLCAKGISLQTGGAVAEFTPIDFYYVLVHASSKSSLESSDSIKDEGVVKADFGDGWYLVQRGFN